MSIYENDFPLGWKNLHPVYHGPFDAQKANDPVSAIIKRFQLVPEYPPVDVDAKILDGCEHVQKMHVPIHYKALQGSLEFFVDEGTVVGIKGRCHDRFT